jgi:hypothetical protein
MKALTAEQKRDAFKEFDRLDNAHHEAKEAISMLAAYFKAVALMNRDEQDEDGMFAASGHERLANTVSRQLDVMRNAARELYDVIRDDTKEGA